MTSAMEAELAAMYKNAQKIIVFRRTLIDMGHPQPPTVIRTDNRTACGILTGTMQQKRSKAIDMRYHWLKEKHNTDFDFQWSQGNTNLANYTTKHHTASHHKRVRPIYLYVKGQSPITLKGCAKILNK